MLIKGNDFSIQDEIAVGDIREAIVENVSVAREQRDL